MKWTTIYSNEYFGAIEDINDAYKRMLSIGEAEKVFRDKVCPIMTAKTKAEFVKTKRKINKKYWNYVMKAKPVLKLKGDVCVNGMDPKSLLHWLFRHRALSQVCILKDTSLYACNWLLFNVAYGRMWRMQVLVPVKFCFM